MDNDYFRTLLKAPRPKLQPIPTKDVCEIEKEQENKRIKAERAECHRKKKEHYMKMKQKYENNLLELTKKYRDRAQERRERINNEPNIDDAMLKKNGYHAVAPDLRSSINAREIKDKMIEESKYLGGDIEHTHLVKGLDYALLQKVREEIKIKEADEASTNEMVNGKPKEKDKEIPVECKSYLANQKRRIKKFQLSANHT
uniref:RED-like N-terminal domain-containing protein n=1 Tax=Clastoptera arizonana TaxID=38151 RepID=A0A1B6CDQ4_9HEMI